MARAGDRIKEWAAVSFKLNKHTYTHSTPIPVGKPACVQT
jgi:hypothetical protein